MNKKAENRHQQMLDAMVTVVKASHDMQELLSPDADEAAAAAAYFRGVVDGTAATCASILYATRDEDESPEDLAATAATLGLDPTHFAMTMRQLQAVKGANE